jgi:hypothetical protein
MVVDFAGDSLVVSGRGGRHTILKSYLDEEDEGSKLAILSIDSAELEGTGFGDDRAAQGDDFLQ